MRTAQRDNQPADDSNGKRNHGEHSYEQWLRLREGYDMLLRIAEEAIAEIDAGRNQDLARGTAHDPGGGFVERRR